MIIYMLCFHMPPVATTYQSQNSLGDRLSRQLQDWLAGQVIQIKCVTHVGIPIILIHHSKDIGYWLEHMGFSQVNKVSYAICN